jgi:tetratricopeptide (TPR) repeat protein
MAGKTRSLQELSAEVATNPNSTAFVELAAAYRERGDLDRALRLCLRGIQRHPTHVEAHYELGRIYNAMGERELALDEWAVVRQLAPEHLPSRLAMTRLYLDEGRSERAEEELQAAEQLAPGDAAIAALWKELAVMRRDGTGVEEDRQLFASLQDEYPGTLGILLVDGEGEVLEGRMTPQGVESDRSLASTLSGAADEAKRVASYLALGPVRSVMIESAVVRLMIRSVGSALIVLATACDVPPGRSHLAMQRAEELAGAYLDRMEG